MSSQTVNYSSSARSYGLIIHSEVTIGYDTPWRQVHQLLIDAAQGNARSDAQEPAPFVLETSPEPTSTPFIRSTLISRKRTR